MPSSVLPNLDGAPQDGMRFVGEDMLWDARSENVAFVCICMHLYEVWEIPTRSC